MWREGQVEAFGREVWVWSRDTQHRHVPTQLPSAAFDGGNVVMMAAGMRHTGRHTLATPRLCLPPVDSVAR